MAFMQYHRRFRRHEITVERESRTENWYIRVTDHDGGDPAVGSAPR